MLFGLAFKRLSLINLLAVPPHCPFRRVSVCLFDLSRDINGICSIASWEGVCSKINLIHNAVLTFIAEDVLGDLGVRQAIRGMSKNARL